MSLQKLPGLIDIHVHLREPGATHKEDFQTGSRAAIAGGFTFIIDMPNNPKPTISLASLNEKITLTKQKAICDIGFHFGTNGENMDQFALVWNLPQVFGLKVYCSQTTGNMIIEDERILTKIFSGWQSEKPILVHAEGDRLEMVINLARKFKRRLHVCHISLKEEVEIVRRAKKEGQSVTAGVTPHHLYFYKGPTLEALKGYGIMKPPIGNLTDKESLWEGLKDGTIDLVETDHAPHAKEEKNPPSGLPAFGVPGLETAVGLLYLAVKEGRIKNEEVIKFLYLNPKNIFKIPDQPETYIELNPDKEYLVGESNYESKCGWSPFEGMKLYGKIEKVVLRGEKIFPFSL